MDVPGQPTRRSRPTALGLSGAFAALAFGGWCTVHGVLSLATGAPRPPRARAAVTTPAARPALPPIGSTRISPRPARVPAPAPQPPGGALTPQQLFDRTVPAVVRVNVFDASMQTRKHGSGF